jgi:1,4-dihydroxy-2-naphthoate polyprenyltransferase
VRSLSAGDGLQGEGGEEASPREGVVTAAAPSPELDRADIWILAMRPRTLPAAMAPVLAGTGLAIHDGVFNALPALAAMVGAILIQIGTNLANDYSDFKRGADTHERLGPTRVTQAGLLQPEEVKRGAMVALGAAFVVGIYLVAVGGWPIVVIGLASLVCAVAYTGGPFPLAYNYLGDVFVFLFFGLVAVGGTYWVQAGFLSPAALLVGSGVGALATAILVVNNLRDLETDARAGKRTLATLLGVRGTRIQYMALLFMAWHVPPAGVALYGWSSWTFLAVAALVMGGLVPLRRVIAFQDPRELNTALAGTARLTGLYGALLALGLMLGTGAGGP